MNRSKDVCSRCLWSKHRQACNHLIRKEPFNRHAPGDPLRQDPAQAASKGCRALKLPISLLISLFDRIGSPGRHRGFSMSDGVCRGFCIDSRWPPECNLKVGRAEGPECLQFSNWQTSGTIPFAQRFGENRRRTGFPGRGSPPVNRVTSTSQCKQEISFEAIRKSEERMP